MRRHPERLYPEDQLPEELSNYPIVKVQRTEDFGPATKLIPALLSESEPTTLVITVDDDFIYNPRLVEALAWEAENSPDEAIGVCGWGMMPMMGSLGVVSVYVPYWLRPTG